MPGSTCKGADASGLTHGGCFNRVNKGVNTMRLMQGVVARGVRLEKPRGLMQGVGAGGLMQGDQCRGCDARELIQQMYARG